jgi:hypothetical protein
MPHSSPLGEIGVGTPTYYAKLATALEQSPTFSVGLAPGHALDLNPIALLARTIRSISALRHYPFELHAIGGLQQLNTIIEAFRKAQPVGIYGNDQLLELRFDAHEIGSAGRCCAIWRFYGPDTGVRECLPQPDCGVCP